MGFRYVVIGAGRQGTAAGYDLAVRGQADSVLMADIDKKAARAAAARVNRLARRKVAKSVILDARDQRAVEKVLRRVDGCLSAVPYYFNLKITEAAIKAGAHLTDLGGNADVVHDQLKLSKDALEAGITVVPDCGMGPGMTGSLAAYGISLMDEALDVLILDGGLPQKPEPPWNYRVTFNINGLTNEYDGDAEFLRNWRLVKVPCFSEYELVDFPPAGELEAFVTPGGTSTAILTYKGKLRTYQNKILRYAGHCEQFDAFRQLGLFDLRPVVVGGQKVVPREIFHALLEPEIKAPRNFRDICLIRATVRGIKNEKPGEVVIDLVDKYDPRTGFTSMERLTGWHAAIVLEMAVTGQTKKGVLGLEKALDPGDFIKEARRRGFKIKERWRNLKSL